MTGRILDKIRNLERVVDDFYKRLGNLETKTSEKNDFSAEEVVNVRKDLEDLRKEFDKLKKDVKNFPSKTDLTKLADELKGLKADLEKVKENLRQLSSNEINNS